MKKFISLLLVISCGPTQPAKAESMPIEWCQSVCVSDLLDKMRYDINLKDVTAYCYAFYLHKDCYSSSATPGVTMHHAKGPKRYATTIPVRDSKPILFPDDAK